MLLRAQLTIQQNDDQMIRGIEDQAGTTKAQSMSKMKIDMVQANI